MKGFHCGTGGDKRYRLSRRKTWRLSPAPATDTPGAEDIISGFKKVIARSHARGIRIIGCTIMPTEGATIANYHTGAKEFTRRAVNDWIRTSRAFDGVIDFDVVMRDPGHPDRLNPRLASDDHIHPNVAGYQRMANTTDLSLFKQSPFLPLLDELVPISRLVGSNGELSMSALAISHSSRSQLTRNAFMRANRVSVR